MSKRPTKSDLAEVAAFTKRFEAPDFSPGEWVPSKKLRDDIATLPWWKGSPEVNEWNKALYDHNIIDPDSDYMSESAANLINRSMEHPSLVAELDLPTIRMVLTCISRVERFVEGTMAEAFHLGLAQAATRRLGDFVE